MSKLRELVEPFLFDYELEVETQTDKERTKEVPCRGCRRRLVVSAFYAPVSAATCSVCKAGDLNQSGSIAAPVAGKSDPAKVRDLGQVLVNPHFAHAVCPAHPDNEEHEMELKSVSHSEYHGPSEFAGYDKGRPVYRQLAPGETVMHQCLKCRATVSYSTTAQTQFRRQNEARDTGPSNDGINSMAIFLGVRDERSSKNAPRV